ncbi:MAG: ATP-binding protein [Acutalibacteraceae bacterium]
MSLKSRMVLLHTGLMAFVVCVVLALLFSMSSHEILANAENMLEKRVADTVEDIEYENGRLDFDSDLMTLEHGVYLSVYDKDSFDLLYGRIPYGFAYDLPFENGNLRKITAGEVDYYVFDIEQNIEDQYPVLVRGIISISDAEQDFRYTMWLALILFPLLIFLTAICGYLLSRRALYPVAKITKTVQDIQQEKDLSKRIHLENGSDEIYILAKTFDGLLDTIDAGMQREKQFTNDVAHELRTPISVVLMQCEELLQGDHLDDEGRREVSLIQRKVKGVSDMISQLLLLSRADQGREKINLERVDFSELVEMVAEEFTDLAKEKNIEIQTEIDPELYLIADQTLMIRLLGNLLENAVNYGNFGGHIWVFVRKTDDSIRLFVKDDGIGISQQDLPHIWDRFYQADPARNSESSGLGLSMVKWIVEAHHGKISVSSELGKGTDFTCIFPVADIKKHDDPVI